MGIVRRGTRRYLSRLEFRPAQTLALSFATVILLGAILLHLPASTYPDHRISFLDALFTSTSAVCVTGLVVVDTGTAFTRFGQGVILLLIEVGAIGIMTFAAVFAALFGGLGIRDRVVMQDVMDLGNAGEVGRLIKAVFKVTLAVEAAGALLLYFFFLPYFQDPGEAAYTAFFHAISAFANAGFSTYSDNLMGFRGDVGINVVIILMVVIGGLGFTVIVNLKDYLFKGRQGRLTLHTKIVLSASGILLLVGAAGMLLTEWGHFREMPGWEALLAATFHSVVARTAGFNTIDISLISSGTLLLLLVLMVVGGGPGSTAGGMKLTTGAVLFATIRALFRGRETPELFRRSLPRDIVLKAVALFSLAALGLFAATLLLTLTETAPFHQILFEAASALGTVGLSMGLTPNLSPEGKIIVTLLMFFGRIGPLGLVLAIGQRRKKGLYYYPEERVIMG